MPTTDNLTKLLGMDTPQTPQFVLIGPHKVRISQNYKSKKNLGVFEANKLQIRLRKNLPRSVLLETLWHEIKHANEYLLSLNQLPQEEELRVSLEATFETLFFLSNPDYLEWLTSLCQQITGGQDPISYHFGNICQKTTGGTHGQFLRGIAGRERT